MLGKPSRHTRRHLEDQGRRAAATVLEIGKRGMAITTGAGQLVTDTEVALKLRLRVEPEGEAPFEVRTKLRFPQLAIPSVGSRIAVVYDPDDHESIMRDDSPGATIGAVLGGRGERADIAEQVLTAHSQGASVADLQSLAADLGRQYAASQGAMMSGAFAAPAEDRLTRLEKLADLKAKGILTDAEFQAEKAKILGS